MLNLIVEVIISFFISNYESNKYPYLTCFVKGLVIGFFAFVTSNIIDLFKGSLMTFSQQVIFFCLSLVLGLVMFLFYSFCTWLQRKDLKEKER